MDMLLLNPGKAKPSLFIHPLNEYEKCIIYNHIKKLKEYYKTKSPALKIILESNEIIMLNKKELLNSELHHLHKLYIHNWNINNERFNGNKYIEQKYLSEMDKSICLDDKINNIKILKSGLNEIIFGG